MNKVPEKCSRCGAPISWEEGTSIVKCEFCGYKNNLKDDFLSLFKNYLKLRDPKKIIRNPISLILILPVIFLFLILNSPIKKQGKIKAEYWPNDLGKLKKSNRFNSDKKKYIWPTAAKFKETVGWRKVIFQPDIKQACIYRESLIDQIRKNREKISKSKYEFNVKVGDLYQVYSWPDNVPEELEQEFIEFRMGTNLETAVFPEILEKGVIENYRSLALRNLRYIKKEILKKDLSYRDYVNKEYEKWLKEKRNPLYQIKFTTELRFLASEVEVLRQSGFDDWQLYSRWNQKGIADLFLYYEEKWKQEGKPGSIFYGSSLFKYVLKKGAVKKSDVTKYGNLKYSNIPNVVNDICDS